MTAALYLRSSKDRSDVSLAAQRHELEKLAASRSLKITRIYEDAVESGSTQDRPGFIQLVHAIKDSSRGWSHLLVYDTSRIARRRYIAQAIKHEAKKRGVVILYARMPADLDPVAELVLESVFEAMDEAHSILSREKGLAGMAENVRQGWRAGGRAPFGYRLHSNNTGAIREGQPVTKSTLVPSEHASRMSTYLRSRAQGVPRVQAAKAIGLPSTSLIGMEWNALTYAGHTVWNRHAPNGRGVKMRPRAEWQITRSTHEALITDAEAELLLSQLLHSAVGDSVRRAKASQSRHLLTGQLWTPDGQMWVGHGKFYRIRAKGARGKLVQSAPIDTAVLDQVRTDLRSEIFLSKLLKVAQNSPSAIDPAAPIEARIRQLEKEKAKAAELALGDAGETFLNLVRSRSDQIETLRREASSIRKDTSLSDHIGRLTVTGLREMVADADPAKAIEIFVDRVELDTELTCRIQYRTIPGAAAWRSMASPRESDSSPRLVQVVVLEPPRRIALK